jgi:hypothetical protein
MATPRSAPAGSLPSQRCPASPPVLSSPCLPSVRPCLTSTAAGHDSMAAGHDSVAAGHDSMAPEHDLGLEVRRR